MIKTMESPNGKDSSNRFLHILKSISNLGLMNFCDKNILIKNAGMEAITVPTTSHISDALKYIRKMNKPSLTVLLNISIKAGYSILRLV